MIKKLRNRFLLMNMLILTLVMLLAFVTIFVISKHNSDTAFNRTSRQFMEATLFVNSLNNSLLAEIEGSSYEQSDGIVEIVFPRGLLFRYESDGITYYSFRQDMIFDSGIFYSSEEDFTAFGAILDSEDIVTDLIYTQDMTFESQLSLIDLGKNISDGISHLNHAGRDWWVWRLATYEQVPTGNNTFTVYRDAPIANAIVMIDVTPMRDALNNLILTLGVTGLIMLVVLGFASLLIANQSIKPVQTAWDRQQQFLGDASHELKTPITSLNASLDAVEGNAEETVFSQQKWLDNMRLELARMSKLVTGLLYLARTEGSQGYSQVFDLSTMVSDMSLSFEAALYERGINYSDTIAEGIMVHGNPEQIQKALLNLMDNAQLYTDTNGWIKVALSKSGSHAILSYQNSGPGISPEDLPRIFDRFYRPDPSRATESGGFGLGLSISKAIIDQAGGRITAHSTEGVTEFVVNLKLA